MALNTKDFLATFKKQAYISLIQNMEIDFPSIKNTILHYSTSQEGDIGSSLNLYPLNLKSLSSATINAAIQLVYLDFYAMYTMLYSMYSNYQGLLDASKNKYIYLNNLYKDMESIINSKELNKSSKYVTYIDFENKNSVIPYKADILSRTGTIVKQLQFEDVMSLPINSSTAITPSTIVPINLDQTDSTTKTDKGEGYIYFDVIRSQNDYVSLVKSVNPSTHFVSKSTSINLSGSIVDIAMDKMYAKLTTIDASGNAWMSYSSNGKDWSDWTMTPKDESTPVMIEGNILTGIVNTMSYDATAKVDDSWLINLSKVQLPYPSTELKIKFDKFDNISLITMDDISPYRLELDKVRVRQRRYSDMQDQESYIKLKDKTIIFQDSQLEECDITFTQKDSDIFNNNGSIGHKYSFYLDNIKAISNEYLSQGSLSFNAIDVTDINNISIDVSEYTGTSNMFIEYNMYAEAGIDKVAIPCLTSAQAAVNEYIIPTQSATNTEITYVTRFPVNVGQPITLVNLNTGWSTAVHGVGSDPYIYYENVDDTILHGYIKLVVKEYNLENQYAIRYTPKIWRSADTYDLTNKQKWHSMNKINYMYYMDADSKVRMAIKLVDVDGNINLFSGKLSSLIEIRSIDQKYMSPYITQYTVKYN